MKKMIGLSIAATICWIVMFLAGTDVWHYIGSPDFWRLSGPPYTDMRAFGYAFYMQLLLLLAGSAMGIWEMLKALRSRERAR